MKSLRNVIALALVAALAMPVLASCPDSGFYRTSNNTMLSGRVSEAWCNGGPGQPGNTENALSFDGTTLGSQWRMWGMAIDANGAQMVENTVDANGDGYVDYSTNYVGGQFWLSGDHSWSVDGADLTGSITYFNVAARVVYSDGEMVGISSNVYLTGSFDGCPDCEIAYSLSNAELAWSSAFGTPAPENYPAFLCDASLGELFHACCILTTITCGGVSTESSTWGAMKSIYR